ncbi:MAG: hypothetical protein WAP03_16045 [Methylorubrum rhodinum]
MRGPGSLTLDRLTPTVIRARRLVVELEAEPVPPINQLRHWFRRGCVSGIVAQDLAIAHTPECARHPLVAEAISLEARLLKIKHHACSKVTCDLVTKDLSEIREY